MSEKLRPNQRPKAKPLDDEESNASGLSEQAHEALDQVSETDTMINDILSSATNGNYLESIRQRGGQ